MADENGTGAHGVQRDRPASPDAETREQTIARVVDGPEAADAAAHGGSSDPSVRHGVQRTLIRTMVRAGAVGAVVGAVAGIVLSQVPGPGGEGRGLGLEGGGPWHVVSYAIVMAIGVAIIVGVVYGALWTLAREDGRIEREVEQRTGRGPEGPGSPSSPRTDLKKR